MRTLVDASALVTLLDAADPNHAAARATWARLLSADASLETTNYSERSDRMVAGTVGECYNPPSHRIRSER